MPLLPCRHMRVVMVTSSRCHERSLSCAEHEGIITITEQEGPWHGTNTKTHQHNLLRLERTIEVSNPHPVAEAGPLGPMAWG